MFSICTVCSVVSTALTTTTTTTTATITIATISTESDVTVGDRQQGYNNTPIGTVVLNFFCLAFFQGLFVFVCLFACFIFEFCVAVRKRKSSKNRLTPMNDVEVDACRGRVPTACIRRKKFHPKWKEKIYYSSE